MAGSAFNISQDQFDSARGIGGFALRNERGGKIDRVLQGQDKTERMGILQIRSQHIGRGHGTGHAYGAVNNRLARRNCAVVAAQTEAAVSAQGRLGVSCLRRGRAAVGSVGLDGKGLIPEGSVADARMRRMTILAGAGARARDGRFAASSHVMDANDVSDGLGSRVIY